MYFSVYAARSKLRKVQQAWLDAHPGAASQFSAEPTSCQPINDQSIKLFAQWESRQPDGTVQETVIKMREEQRHYVRYVYWQQLRHKEEHGRLSNYDPLANTRDWCIREGGLLLRTILAAGKPEHAHTGSSTVCRYVNLDNLKGPTNGDSLEAAVSQIRACSRTGLAAMKDTAYL